MTNRVNTETIVLLLIFQNMPCYFWIITWMKNVNNFQVAKVQPKDFFSICLFFFCQFHPGVAYKGVAYKKACNFQFYYYECYDSRGSPLINVQLIN